MTEQELRMIEAEMEFLTRSGAFYRNPDPHQRNIERIDKWLEGKINDEELKEQIEVINA